MKVSLNWVKQFLDFELSPVDELVRKIGAQLGAVEEVINLGEKYRGIVIVRVVKCEPHPGADKLKVCMIDDGGATPDVKRDSDNLIQVVCGAPNVRENFMAAWIPPGVTVPSTIGKEPFVLEARELRGVVSNGMLASPKELDISDSHDDILEIDKDVQPGDDFAKAYKLDDYIIDIENKMFTHRPDCFGALGVAREIAGILHKPFKSPEWFVPSPVIPSEAEESRKVSTKADEISRQARDDRAPALPLTVQNELPELVPRFSAITMSDVSVGPSPVWLQVALMKVGQKSINNVVDLTNFYMLLTGQPLHAYDYDKVKTLSSGDKATIVIRNPKPGEKIKLLGGKEIEPRAEAIMIATDKGLIGIGGVMGGAETEVGEKTRNIILECANFDMYSIRRTAMAHGLFTDAVTRFTKGQSPLQCLAVSAKAVGDIKKLTQGKVAGQVIDENHLDKTALNRGSLYEPVKVSADFINLRLGLELPADEIKKLLESVECKVEVEGSELTITAPFWRTDIELREDIVEEVGRLYGYDHLPLTLPKRDLAPAPKDPLLALKTRIRDKLSRAGANEVLTYSFVHADLLEKTGQDKAKAFQISNALSPDLQYYRLSLMPSLLEKVHPNIKAGYDEFALFEIGKTHGLDHTEDDGGLPGEFEFTALVVTAADKLKKTSAAYYRARKYLETLVWHGGLEFKPLSQEMQQYPVVQPYDLNRAALVTIKGGEFLGIIGEFKPGVTRALKLPAHTAGFEIDTTVLGPILAAGPSYAPLSRFPSVKQDMTLKLPADLPYTEAHDFVDKELGAKAPDDSHIQLDLVDVYQKPDDKQHKQVTFRTTITGMSRTLTDPEVNKLLDVIAEAAKAKFGAERI